MNKEKPRTEGSMEMYTVVEGLALVAWGKFFY